MTRKIFYSFLLISVIGCFMLTYCGGGGRYGEVKKLLNEYINASKKLFKSLESANDGKAVAKALREYAKVMKVLSPKVEALPDKYPELQDDPPAELKDLVQEFETSMDGIMKAMEKAMKYIDDPEVIKALEEFQDI